MKKLTLIFITLPFLLLGQSSQTIDTLENKEFEIKGELLYKIGSDEPFTGIVIHTFNDGFNGEVWNYTNGKQGLRYTYWEFIDDKKIEITYTLKGNTWKEISQTNYNNNGQKLFHADYENDTRTSWYEDGNIKEEKGISNNETYRKIWDHNGDEILLGSTTPRDSVDINEIEWPNYIPHRKGNSKPFTGVITLSGEFDYNKFRVRENDYYSTVNFVFGKLNGIYTTWYQKDGHKKSEKSLLDGENVQWLSGTILDGPFSEWYENGQLKSKGTYFLGDINGLKTTWYENGVTKSEEEYSRGNRNGYHRIWFENGQKKSETLYSDNKTVKIIEWDENGDITKEWPEKDEDQFGLKTFTNDVLNTVKTKGFNALEKFHMTKENILLIFQRPNTEENLAKLNAMWPKVVSKTLEMVKKEMSPYFNLPPGTVTPDDYISEVFPENGTIQNIFYDYTISNENKDVKVKWPESKDYDISNALVLAKVNILYSNANEQIEILISPVYINNTWCLIDFSQLK